MVEAVSTLTKLHHENIHPLVGITTQFDSKISLVSKWMENGNAHEYVQSVDVDPTSSLLVCRNTSHFPDDNATKIFYLAPWSCNWTTVSSQSSSSSHIPWHSQRHMLALFLFLGL